jgi:hypothetical protein
MTFRRIRILLLLGALVAALGFTWLERRIVRAWDLPLQVEVFPINGDGSAEAADYIRALQPGDFDEINAFLQRETERYGVKQNAAAQIALQPEIAQQPPAPPLDGNVLKTVWWSLQLRTWVYRQSDTWLPELGKVKLFVLYHRAHEGEPLAHSLGLQKGLIGVAHVFADRKQAQQNNIVLAHELLHTLGATDKYDAEGRPLYPQGYADPELPPETPRREAEIMAGRLIAPSGRAVMPASLAQCVIGAQTAHEINLDEGFRRRFAADAKS